MKIIVIQNQNINPEQLSDILQIKEISWPHGLESQIKWIKKNNKNDDLHFLLYDNKSLQGYLSIINTSLIIDDLTYPVLGIGCVCVKCRGYGYGKILMSEVNKYIENSSKIAILFCKENLLEFYKKVGWMIVDGCNLSIEGSHNHNIIFMMHYNLKKKYNHLTYKERIF